MVRKLIVPLLVMGAVISAVMAPAASAGSREVYVDNQRSAFSTFYAEDGCYRLSGVMTIGEGKTRSNQGENGSDASGYGFIDVYDACAQQWVLMVEIGGDDVNVSIAPSLRHASIADTFTTYNYLSDTDVSIDVNLVWQGSGKKSHDRDVVEVEYPGPEGSTVYAISKANYHWVSATVSGTIAIDGHAFSIETENADILGVKAVSHNTTK